MQKYVSKGFGEENQGEQALPGFPALTLAH